MYDGRFVIKHALFRPFPHSLLLEFLGYKAVTPNIHARVIEVRIPREIEKRAVSKQIQE
jgi:hypothetical protein